MNGWSLTLYSRCLRGASTREKKNKNENKRPGNKKLRNRASSSGQPVTSKGVDEDEFWLALPFPFERRNATMPRCHIHLWPYEYLLFSELMRQNPSKWNRKKTNTQNFKSLLTSVFTLNNRSQHNLQNTFTTGWLWIGNFIQTKSKLLLNRLSRRFVHTKDYFHFSSGRSHWFVTHQASLWPTTTLISTYPEKKKYLPTKTNPTICW